MTSNERHEARYRRRKAKREKIKAQRNQGHGFEEVTDFNNLRKAFYSARKGVNWKASVQRYGSNVLVNSIKASETLRAGKPVTRGFIEFDITERGKKRHISSVHITERVVQKSICDFGIVPVIEKSLIYDNAASQKGKGTDFARERLKKHLRHYYRKNGADGYILLCDCHNYFPSLNHDVIRANLKKTLTDERLIELTMEYVNPFKEGLGLGSQVCQILAVAYLNDMDHAIKEIKRIKYYGRYMDDMYVICKSKEEAKKILEFMKGELHDHGIELNYRKTQIVKLGKEFVWLQDRVTLTKSGKVIVKPGRTAITRNRRRLKRMSRLLADGRISYKEVRTFHASHVGYLKNKNAYFTVRNFNELHNKLYIRRWQHEVCNA